MRRIKVFVDSDVIISQLNDKYILAIVPELPPAMSVITYGELLYGIKKSKGLPSHEVFRAMICRIYGYTSRQSQAPISVDKKRSQCGDTESLRKKQLYLRRRSGNI